MALQLAGEAALGALLDQLLEGLINLSEKGIHFKPELESIKSQVRCLIPLMNQVDELVINNMSDDESKNYTNTMKEVMNKGKELIRECEDVKQSNFLKYLNIPSYTKKLTIFDAELQKATFILLLQLNVQQINMLLSINNNINDATGGAHHLNNNNYQTIKLPLLFYHDKRLKGRTGANFFDALLGRAVEHIKNDPKEGVEGRIKEYIKKQGIGRFEKIFHRTFETMSNVGGDDEEKLVTWFACDLLTSTSEEDYKITNGVLFVSTTKLAFCSLKRHASNPNTTKSFYLKVVIPFQLLKDVVGFDEKEECIKVICVDNQEFGFMKFRNYNKAKQRLYRTRSTHNS